MNREFILQTDLDFAQHERVILKGDKSPSYFLIKAIQVTLNRITFDDQIMGGRACIRGTRTPVTVVLKMLAGGMTARQILSDYPFLEQEDIDECIQYAALLADEQVVSRST